MEEEEEGVDGEGEEEAAKKHVDNDDGGGIKMAVKIEITKMITTTVKNNSNSINYNSNT